MKNNAWIITDYNDVDTKIDSVGSKIKVDLFLSPSDMPIATRGHGDPVSKKLIIEFMYDRPLSDSDLVQVQSVDSVVTIFVDKTANKVSKIEVDVIKLDANEVTLNLKSIKGAIDRVKKELSKQKPKAGFVAANRVLASGVGKKLESQFTPSA